MRVLRPLRWRSTAVLAAVQQTSTVAVARSYCILDSSRPACAASRLVAAWLHAGQRWADCQVDLPGRPISGAVKANRHDS